MTKCKNCGSERKVEKGIKEMKPKPYDMNVYEDRVRWFKEMFGYLRTDDFVNQGTDVEGRQFALDAFVELSEIIVNEAFEDVVEK